MQVVITGGPGSGKTTLVEALGALGYATVVEAAIQVIARLIDEMGLEEQREWRRAHLTAFQERVARLQVALEREAAAVEGVVFLDRGRLDGLAYCRHFGYDPPPFLVAAATEHRYERVFLLDTLPSIPDRSHTGRTSDREVSVHLRDRIGEVYREHGLEPVFVPVLPVDERVRLVLRELGLPEPATT